MNFFSTGQLLVQVNTTIITLIPKVDRPTSVKHFRPISCCNVLYKAISKILCARLALILPDLINRSQGAFVKGRSILENILICQDLVWFHPLCKSLRLTHLLLVDDLLMFCRGDVRSIMLILRAFSTFSAASGLKVNADKSEVVFNGFPDWLRTDITHISGFQEGSLPFRYLGVPVQPGRLTMSDCNILIEKIVHKIRGIGARKMSYADRLVLINSVLNTLHSYWSSIFLIPKGVVQRIEAIYCNFLWSSDEVYHRTPLVAWDNNWRNVCKVRDVLAGGFHDNQWVIATRGYSVSSGYHWLRGPHPPVQWSKAVWDRWNIPKQAFIGWLIHREALNTRAKLHHLGLCDSDLCVLCERGVETYAHLFSECAFSSQILLAVEHWLQLCLFYPRQSYSKIQQKTCSIVKSRLKQLVHLPVASSDRLWLNSIGVVIDI
ncbi:uncharacterized protein LOC141641116 [Silene latifolia]|uniref:uncharacterized protein LOC141641116 n=1 Tax=Silene latifolia TaxID=37657 RepID=UPI003D781EDF